MSGTPTAPIPADHRFFLLLQGPKSSFFKKLGAALRKQGHTTLRINFNGGDRLHYSSRYAQDFLGTLEEWREAVLAIAQQHAVTDLILYGDCRPLHQIAIQQLVPLGVRIHVFEEGYFRPHWITLEQGGVNGFSPLPRQVEFYRSTLPGDELATLPIGGTSFPRLVRHTISYYMASALGEARYRHYTTHRPRTYQTEGAAWVWRLAEIWMTKRLRYSHKRRLITDERPYFLVLLQLLGDSQITHHSPYHDMYEFLNAVLNDFVENAPPNTRIIVKNHPLDNGLTRYRSFLAQKARSLGLGDRLAFVDGGHLPTLLNHAIGVVTVNSTGGLSAIHHGKPLKTMGHAIYDLPGLVDQQPLASFWQRPQAPDSTLYKSFRHQVMSASQVNGGFYQPAAIRMAVKGSVARILALPVGRP